MYRNMQRITVYSYYVTLYRYIVKSSSLVIKFDIVVIKNYIFEGQEYTDYPAESIE